MTEDQVKDLTERLESLQRRIWANPDMGTAGALLEGRAEGIGIALSYLKEYQ